MKNNSVRHSFKRSCPTLIRMGAIFGMIGGGLHAPFGAQGIEVLHHFSYSDGAQPAAALKIDANAIYGTTRLGGNWNNGVIFKVNRNGTQFERLYQFSNPDQDGYNADGGNPTTGLVLAGETLYGTAPSNGLGREGTLFSIKTNGTGFTVLHTFSPFGGGDVNSDGARPGEILLLGDSLIGVAKYGGLGAVGTIYKVRTNGTGFVTLHSFGGGGDGENPYSGLTLVGETLYGSTAFGGSAGNGTIFKIQPDGSGYVTLYSFPATNANHLGIGTNLNGATPMASVVSAGGALIGAAGRGGIYGFGTLFRINTNGLGFTLLHSFNATTGDHDSNTDGGWPQATLAASGEKVYGTGRLGGSGGNGTVFSINSDGTAFNVLHNFSTCDAFSAFGHSTCTNNNGAEPYAPLVLDGTTLYGTAEYGGMGFSEYNNSSGSGTVFKIPLAPPPSKLASTVSPSGLTIAFPNSSAGLALQSTTNLSVPKWRPVASLPTNINGNHGAIVQPTNNIEFFRLSPGTALSDASTPTTVQAFNFATGSWEPFFPFGYYIDTQICFAPNDASVPNCGCGTNVGGAGIPWPLLQASGLNTIITGPDVGQPRFQPCLQAILDGAQARGMKVILGVKRELVNRADLENPASCEALIAFIETYRSHPALLGWMLGDENPSCRPHEDTPPFTFGACPTSVAHAAALFHTLDGFHQTWQVFGGLQNGTDDYELVDDYLTGTDVVITDQYFERANQPEFSGSSTTLYYYQNGREHFTKRARCWGVVTQGFGGNSASACQTGLGIDLTSKRLPTAREFRWNVLAAITAGRARAVIAWILPAPCQQWYSNYANLQDFILTGVAPAFFELSTLKSAMESGYDVGNVAVTTGAATAPSTLLLYDGISHRYHLIVVNLQGPLSATFQLSGLPSEPLALTAERAGALVPVTAQGGGTYRIENQALADHEAVVFHIDTQ